MAIPINAARMVLQWTIQESTLAKSATFVWADLEVSLNELLFAWKQIINDVQDGTQPCEVLKHVDGVSDRPRIASWVPDWSLRLNSNFSRNHVMIKRDAVLAMCGSRKETGTYQ